jgi:hypothetical protein
MWCSIFNCVKASRVCGFMMCAGFVLFSSIIAGASKETSSHELSQAPHAVFGLGLITGIPTGLSGEYELSPERAIDMSVAGYVDTGRSLHVHADYLFKKLDFFPNASIPIDLYYGIGGRYLLYNSCCRASNDLNRFGLRFPIGLTTYFSRQRIQVFAEAALIADLITAMGFDLDYAVGARYFF